MYLELRKSGSLVGAESASDGFEYGVLAWYKVPHKNVSDWRHGTRTHEGNYFLNSLILLALMPVFAVPIAVPSTSIIWQIIGLSTNVFLTGLKKSLYRIAGPDRLFYTEAEIRITYMEKKRGEPNVQTQIQIHLR